MIFNKEHEKLKLKMQLRYMENFARMFGPEHAQKVEMARITLREMQKLDPHAMTVAMTMVGCEGFVELIDKHEELIVAIAQSEFKP
jgi:hypothetical protein